VGIEMAHGLITRIEDNFMIVMTDQMTIDKLKLRPHVKVGQRIEFTKRDIYRGFLLFNYKKASSMLALILVLILTSIVAFGQNGSREIYAVVSIDINPSIELNLDQSGIVVGYKSFNEDGQKILSRSLLNQGLEDALSQIFLLAQEKQYLVDRDMILISSTVLKIDDTKLDTTQDTLLEEQIESYMIANKAKYQFIYIEGTERAQNSKPTLSLGRETLDTLTKDHNGTNFNSLETMVDDLLPNADMDDENPIKIIIHDDSTIYDVLSLTKPLITLPRPTPNDILASTQRSMAFESGAQDNMITRSNHNLLFFEEISNIKSVPPQASTIAYENTSKDSQPKDSSVPSVGNRPSTSDNNSNEKKPSVVPPKDSDVPSTITPTPTKGNNTSLITSDKARPKQEEEPDELNYDVDKKIETNKTESETNSPQPTPESNKPALPGDESDKGQNSKPETNESSISSPESDKASLPSNDSDKPKISTPETNNSSNQAPANNESSKPTSATDKPSKSPNPTSDK
jgi:hypothetical protein